MAVVVWLFAGGGESEIRGLFPFLERNFPCDFQRKTPIRQKPGPRPSRPIEGLGRTGRSLAKQIELQLDSALSSGDNCELILVVDDLDCHDRAQRERLFLDFIEKFEGATGIQRLIGFAVPELEAWIIADWNNTIAKDVDFRNCQRGMQRWLSTQRNVSFETPETFSTYDSDRDSCAEKLSDAIVEAAFESSQRYSKAIHTPRLLMRANPQTIQQKCPIFRDLYITLLRVCNP